MSYQTSRDPPSALQQKAGSFSSSGAINIFQAGQMSSPFPEHDISPADEYESDDEDGVFTYTLHDAPIPAGNLKDWQDRRRTLKFKLSPLHGSGISWIDEKSSNETSIKRSVFPEETKMFPADIPDTTFADAYIKFVNDSHDLYMSLMEEEESRKSKENILPKYTSVFIQILDSARRQIVDDRLSEAYIVCHCLFASYFVDPKLTRAESIMDWLNQDDPRPTIDETREIMTTSIPAEQARFWELIHKHAMRGLLRQCSNCIKESGIIVTDSDTQAILESTLSILETAPKGAKEFANHRQWRSRVITLGEKAAKISDPKISRGLTTLSNILRGDTDTILALSDTWQEATASLFLFRDPSPSRLTEYYQIATARIPVDMTVVAEIGCAAIMAGDIPKALSVCERLDVCVAAHMADFCDRQAMLDDFYSLGTLGLPSFRDYLFMAHGINCCSNTGTWFIGATYLRNTDGIAGLAIIRESITRVFLDSENTVRALLELCAELQFEQERQQIVISWSKLQLARKEVGGALLSLDSIGNGLELRAVVFELLKSSFLHGLDIPDPVVQRFLSSPHMCPDMIREFIAPFAIYSRFKDYMHSGALPEAAQCIASLLQFKFLPGIFFGVLIGELLPLIDRQIPRTLSANDLVAVMNSFYQWEKNPEAYNDGISFLDEVLTMARASKQTLASDDWRADYTEFTAKDILKTARTRLLKEMSRAYLEGE